MALIGNGAVPSGITSVTPQRLLGLSVLPKRSGGKPAMGQWGTRDLGVPAQRPGTAPSGGTEATVKFAKTDLVPDRGQPG